MPLIAVRTLMPRPDASAESQPALDLREVFESERPKLLRFLRKNGPPAEAEDLLQQSFMRLVAQEPKQAAEVRSPGSYLRRTASNLIRDLARASNRRLAGSHIEADEQSLPGADPIAALEARDMLERLEAIIARMPPRRREIFLAHRVDGYSYGEIAARLGLSIKGVEKQMSRAIAQIDRLMARS